ncbi:MAG: TrkH family potassium uptake protein [Clostridia bacterium]|nr:TrkH family potassium uptake protein [Clostridia bacterium]MBQ4354268.1 TrkH family potassium uptake protein [Clostridia bacterium]
MNIRRILYTLGQLIKLEGVLLALPLATALCYGEDRTALAFLITMAGALLIAFLMTIPTKKADATIYAREGFIITASAWLFMSAIGALPFVLSGDIPSYIDAYFETVSGFTTTGASILTDVEAMSHGCLFWRSFTHWIGGMGILVLMMAIFSDSTGRSIHIMRAEMPGPIVERIVPRVRNTAKILYLIYIVMTCVQILLHIIGGMPVFDSIIHSLGTAGTGGFGIKSNGLAGYSAYHQWVITIFMLLFGVNFNLYYLILIKKWKDAVRSEELWVYLGVVAAASTLIAFNIYPMVGTAADSVRYAAFQVASIITTTGYSTVDFNLWPGLSKTILLLLMFMGGCAGSTAGGMKVSRAVILVKSIRCELKRLIHPREVANVRFESKKLEEQTRHGVGVYFALYALCIAAVFLCLSFEPFDIETNFSAAVACFNNVGPGLAGVGPMSSYAAYSDSATVLLSLAMLFGRLEIYPMLILLSPRTWIKK